MMRDSQIPEDQRCHCKPWTQEMVDASSDSNKGGCIVF